MSSSNSNSVKTMMINNSVKPEIKSHAWINSDSYKNVSESIENPDKFGQGKQVQSTG